jgi:L-amino acid N-acyltransferase YncA
MRKTALTLVALMLCVSVVNLFAQNKAAVKREFKFGKIEPADFNIKASGKDSSAAAIKLFDIGNCYFEISPSSGNFIYVFERHIRYKILNKNGYDLANYNIELYRNDNASKEDLNYMDAATYNMVDGKMVISKLNKDAKFTEVFNKNQVYKKFTLPNVKEGSIIEFKYKIKSDFIFTLRGWRFQSDIPTLYSEYNVSIPEYLTYKTNMGGYYSISHPLHKTETVTYLPGLSSSAVHDQFSAENVPALKDEPFITTMDDYLPKITFELQGTQFPNQIYKDYNGTWPKIVKGLAEDENFGLFINKNSYAKSVLPGILKGEKDTLASIKLIYNYVKNNIKWNNEYSKYASGSNPKIVFEKKTGSSADINLSLISLLNEAKITAYPVLVSTRDNGIHPGYPIISKFDNVLAVTSVGNKIYFLDAIDKDMPLGMLDYENLNHQAFYMDLKNFSGSWISTETEFTQEKLFSYNLVLDKENKLKGQINQYSKGYAALSLRNKYRKTSNETEFLKNFKKDKTGLELTSYKIDNLDALDELLTESMAVVIEDNVEEAGNLVYFTPLLFEKTKENMFKHEERKFPIDFAHPIKETYRITLNFPDNYEIDKLPKSAIYKLPDDSGDFSINYVSEGKVLMVKSTININKSVYAPEEYFNLKELFKAIVEKQAEQIVFKKKV